MSVNPKVCAHLYILFLIVTNVGIIAAITARFLLKPQPAVTRTLVCTGERMRDLIAKVYPSTRLTTFHPEHGNGLSNEFRCYASYESDSNNWKWES